MPKFIRYFTSPPVDHWDRPTLVTVSDFGCVLPLLLLALHRVRLWVHTTFIGISSRSGFTPNLPIFSQSYQLKSLFEVRHNVQLSLYRLQRNFGKINVFIGGCLSTEEGGISLTNMPLASHRSHVLYTIVRQRIRRRYSVV